MSIQQISIFLENKAGRLAEITSILAQNSIDIRALSIADTSDYGILRLIVDDPEKAKKTLKASEITVSITDVLGISVNDSPGAFAKAIGILSDANIGVEYAYAFITPEKGKAYVILRVADNDKASNILKESSIKIINQDEIFI